MPASNYSGEAGRAYFEHQRRGGLGRAAAVARCFQPYVGSDDAVLDFGCGAGWVLDALEAREKTGVEVNPAALEIARSHGFPVVESVEDLGDESFDVVISNHALEHTLHPMNELLGLRRVLKPEGRLVLHLPINDWRNERNIGDPDPNHHLYTWTPYLIRNLLAEAGFETEVARVVNWRNPGRLSDVLGRALPDRGYDAAAALTAIVRRRRELRVLAGKT